MQTFVCKIDFHDAIRLCWNKNLFLTWQHSGQTGTHITMFVSSASLWWPHASTVMLLYSPWVGHGHLYWITSHQSEGEITSVQCIVHTIVSFNACLWKGVFTLMCIGSELIVFTLHMHQLQFTLNAFPVIPPPQVVSRLKVNCIIIWNNSGVAYFHMNNCIENWMIREESLTFS